jgi:NNP family nitrate/nitrite transporter-like MFS transporter
MGFATFGVLAALAFGLVVLHRVRWLEWALPKESHAAVEPIRAGVSADSGA